jgi:hypothetical protein
MTLFLNETGPREYVMTGQGGEVEDFEPRNSGALQMCSNGYESLSIVEFHSSDGSWKWLFRCRTTENSK